MLKQVAHRILTFQSDQKRDALDFGLQPCFGFVQHILHSIGGRAVLRQPVVRIFHAFGQTRNERGRAERLGDLTILLHRIGCVVQRDEHAAMLAKFRQQVIRNVHPRNGECGDAPLPKRDGVGLTFDQHDPFCVGAVEMIVVGTALAQDFTRRIVVFLAFNGASAEICQTPPFQMDVNQHPRWKLADDRPPLVGQVEISQQSAFVLAA